MTLTSPALVEQLVAEHQPGTYYRGQSREFAGPLWPSQYRALFRSNDCLTFDQELTLRKSGSRFHLRLSSSDWTPFPDAAAYYASVAEAQVKLFVIRHLRNALGYPLGEACFQQAGWRSEGLDVTSDVKVAMFFALHEWTGSGYRRKPDAAPPSV